MKNKALNAFLLALSFLGIIYGAISTWSGLDPMPASLGITLGSLFCFFFIAIWTAEELLKANK